MCLMVGFRSQLIIMQGTRNLHQGELENIAVVTADLDPPVDLDPPGPNLLVDMDPL
jgi:hypothetical protein